MKAIGKTIRQIRLIKSMKQKDFSEVSQAGIANIESSRKNITLDKLISILDDFGMSLREFEYIRNDYKLSPTDNLFLDFTNVKNSVDRVQGKKLLTQLSSHLEEYPTDFIAYCLYIVEDVILKITAQNSYNIESPEAFEIWSILYGRSAWTYQEVYIMSKLFFVFPVELGTSMIDRIEREMANYVDFLKDIHFDATFYTNVGKYYTHQNQFMLGKKYLNQALPLCEKYDRVIIENDVYAYLAIIDYLEGNMEAEAEVLDCVNRFHAMRKPDLAEDLESDWNTFFKEKVLN
ncbi:helix-turn-helix domain-containing protein [Listeria rustica]|uniref:Helix-turn-helix transcriptional regulator n=1 Tax=Listeria rustica TaxID=2713503 RepID=A0A7W1T6X8_9LIST|nr:helix-turn-helix transcriptional regulator [Listeria rustica]MBA3926588.1 helix-turn-helix transcriptional regulator [Listeria rustica]